MKTPKNYIFKKIAELLIKFPYLKLSYQQESIAETYLIKVTPEEELDSNLDLQRNIIKIYKDAFEKHPYEAIGFVDDDSLFEKDEPIEEFKGVIYEYLEGLKKQPSAFKKVKQESISFPNPTNYNFVA